MNNPISIVGNVSKGRFNFEKISFHIGHYLLVLCRRCDICNIHISSTENMIIVCFIGIFSFIRQYLMMFNSLSASVALI